MNERYIQPAMPEGVEEGIIKGMYLYQHNDKGKHHVQLMGSGAILNEVIAGAELLKKDFDISSDVWSVPSFGELRRDAAEKERQHMMSPDKKLEMSYVEQCLQGREGPVIAATDYVRAYPNMIRPYIDRTMVVLGTDGFGRSDTRERLRQFFEVNRYYVVVAALYALVKEGKVPATLVKDAMKKYGLDPKKPNPVTV